MPAQTEIIYLDKMTDPLLRTYFEGLGHGPTPTDRQCVSVIIDRLMMRSQSQDHDAIPGEIRDAAEGIVKKAKASMRP
jgi:hypothetical protein